MRRTSERLTYFIDRSLGSFDVADALRKIGILVEVHDDHFAQDTTDATWLTEVGRRGWIVLTKDSRIRRHPLETAALLGAGVAAFIVTAGGLTGKEMAELISAAMPRIERVVAKQARPFIATITRGGEVLLKAGGGRRGGIKRD